MSSLKMCLSYNRLYYTMLVQCYMCGSFLIPFYRQTTYTRFFWVYNQDVLYIGCLDITLASDTLPQPCLRHEPKSVMLALCVRLSVRTMLLLFVCHSLKSISTQYFSVCIAHGVQKSDLFLQMISSIQWCLRRHTRTSFTPTGA